MRSTLFILALLTLAACSSTSIQPGPAPAVAGFEARVTMEGYTEYVVMAGPNLPLTPTYKVHGKATGIAATTMPYLRIYLQGDAWIEPTPAGTAAVRDGTVTIYRPSSRATPADSPVGVKVHYAPAPAPVSKGTQMNKETVPVAYLIEKRSGT